MDQKLKELKQYALENGSSIAVISALKYAKKYNGVLEALVMAGSVKKLSDRLGVSYQAVQQWLKTGYVPLARIPEIESTYGVPRKDLMNPKYAAALAEPNFSSDV